MSTSSDHPAAPERATASGKPGRPRGFAAMDPEKVRAISAKGGRAAHASGKAHRYTPDEAKKAGSLGGKAPHVRRGPGSGKKRKGDAEASSQESLPEVT